MDERDYKLALIRLAQEATEEVTEAYVAIGLSAEEVVERAKIYAAFVLGS